MSKEIPKQQRYTIETIQTNTKSETVESNCNEIMFVNNSTTDVVTIDNFPLKPGAFISFGGNKDEICIRKFVIQCPTPGSLWYFRKNYVL